MESQKMNLSLSTHVKKNKNQKVKVNLQKSSLINKILIYFRRKLIPPRPLPNRKGPQRNQNMLAPEGNFMNVMSPSMNLQNGVLLAGYAVFPSVFNLLFQ